MIEKWLSIVIKVSRLVTFLSIMGFKYKILNMDVL